MSVMRTSPTSTGFLYPVIGALIVIAAGLGYYAYDQSQRSAELEITLELPKVSTD